MRYHLVEMRMIDRQFETETSRPCVAAWLAIALVCLMQFGIAAHEAQHGPGDFAHVCDICVQLDANDEFVESCTPSSVQVNAASDTWPTPQHASGYSNTLVQRARAPPSV